MRATKIVVTLGPATSSYERIHQLLTAGANTVRLNFSHGRAEDHVARAENVRAAAQALGCEVAIMADLQGPKIRIGKFAQGRIELQKGRRFILDSDCPLGDAERVGLDYKRLPQDVEPGTILLLDDGLIRLRVDAVEGSRIHTTVEAGGPLSDHKGINRLGGGLSAPALTEKDQEDIRTAAALGADYLAVSFPRSGDDLRTARRLLREAGGHARIIAKIERAEAIDRLDDIIDAADGIMVARGDLAVEVGNAAVPGLQKRMVRKAREHNRLTIIATQMMESMIQHPQPTRAEVSDVANAVLDGADAVMLSAETAVGAYPVDTVETMARICVEAEKTYNAELDLEFQHQTFSRIDQSIAMAALFTAYHLHAKAIAALTQSGATVLWMSRHYCGCPIYAITPEIATQRQMALYRNVRSLRINPSYQRDDALLAAEHLLQHHEQMEAGDLVVFTIGEPMGKSGGTNTMKVVSLSPIDG